MYRSGFARPTAVVSDRQFRPDRNGSPAAPLSDSPAPYNLGLLAFVLLAAGTAGCDAVGPSEQAWSETSWQRHTIDASSVGADGVRVGDINGDGHLDIVSPWEQGGLVRVYLNPGEGGLRDPWPAVTVGEVGDPEDAFFVDLDADGAMDVVSSCEGETRSIFVHWGPTDPTRILDSGAWLTAELPAASGVTRWMFALAGQVDGEAGLDLIVGSKDPDGLIGWFQAPPDPRDLSAWSLHPLYDAGWVMTIRHSDLDMDGDYDIVATDRRGAGRGALWLEHPGAEHAAAGRWTEHRIGPKGSIEAMHNAIADLDGDGMDDVLFPSRQGPVRFHRRTRMLPPSWEAYRIEMPPNAGVGKAVAAGDIDLDGQLDVVVSCADASDGRIGLFWLAHGGDPTRSSWLPRSISGPEGFIFDLIQLLDLDSDGDLDVVTLEEKGPYLQRGYQGSELGVVWYENPAR